MVSLPARSAASVPQPGPAPRARAAALPVPAEQAERRQRRAHQLHVLPETQAGFVRSKLRPLLLLPGAVPHQPSLPWEGFKHLPVREISHRLRVPRAAPSSTQRRWHTGLDVPRARRGTKAAWLLSPREMLPPSPPAARNPAGAAWVCAAPSPHSQNPHLAQTPTVMLLPLTFNPGPKQSEGVKPGNKPHCPQRTNASLRKICY